MKPPPKFSVVTVSFNHADFIRQTIESVLMQRYPNFEHLIIDGGSTDETTDILNAYPHLVWTSEPDRGQSHALNKGFARATGDIIAWINSDDWYAPGIFKDIALALEECSIVMGACELTDKYGAFKELYPNYERSWFDLLKYWVFHSSPSQPSIFFRRELLEEFKLPNGNYIDEDLDFCMDFDLWLRITAKHPLARRIPRVFSYYRTYESNKTGEMMDATYREMARVFRRHANRLCQRERALSIVIPMSGPDPSLEKTVESLARQGRADCELLVVDYAREKDTSRMLRRATLNLGRKYEQTALRYVKADGATWAEAWQWSLDAVRAPLLGFIQPGVVLPERLVGQVEETFRMDTVGAALPMSREASLLKAIAQEVPGGHVFRPDAAFIFPVVQPNIFLRHVAAKELGGFKDPHTARMCIPLLLRQLLLRLSYKSWGIDVQNRIDLPLTSTSAGAEVAYLEAASVFFNAALISSLHREFEKDPFAKTRAQHGFCFVMPDNIRASAEKLLSLAPVEWTAISVDSAAAELEEIVSRFPNFSPAWYLLKKRFQDSHDSAREAIATQGLERAQSAVQAL